MVMLFLMFQSFFLKYKIPHKPVSYRMLAKIAYTEKRRKNR